MIHRKAISTFFAKLFSDYCCDQQTRNLLIFTNEEFSTFWMRKNWGKDKKKRKTGDGKEMTEFEVLFRKMHQSTYVKKGWRKDEQKTLKRGCGGGGGGGGISTYSYV